MTDPIEIALLSIAVLGTVGHLVWGDHRPPSLLKAAIKSLAVGGMAGLAIVNGAPWLLIAGLVFSVLGDALLVGEGDKWLLPGMAAFFTAHAAYIALFVMNADQAPLIAHSAVFVIAGAIMLAWLWPSLGPMRIPVIAYTAIIVAMAISATTLTGTAQIALSGAAAFMLSDALLAGNLFRFPPGHAARVYTSPAVWLLYVLAQALILAAFVPELRPFPA